MSYKVRNIALATMIFCSFAAVSNSSELHRADYTAATNLVFRGDCKRAWELIRNSIVTQPESLDRFLTFAFSNGFRVYPPMKNERDFAQFFVAVSIMSFKQLDDGAVKIIDTSLYQMIDAKSRSEFMNCVTQGLPCREEAFFSLARKSARQYVEEFVASMLDVESYGFCPAGLGVRRK